MKREVQSVAAIAEEKPSNSAEISSVIEKTKLVRDQAAAEAQSLREATSGMLLRSTDAEMEAHDESIRNADRRRERAEQFLELLNPKLEEAQYREDQEKRQKVYDAALAAHEEARKLECEDYPKAAAAIRNILQHLESLYDQIRRANDYRPDGERLNEIQHFKPLIHFEDFRGVQGHPAYDETVTERYWEDSQGYEISYFQYSASLKNPHQKLGYVEKTREKQIHHTAAPDQFPHGHLFTSIQLPGVKLYDDPFWPPKR